MNFSEADPQAIEKAQEICRLNTEKNSNRENAEADKKRFKEGEITKEEYKKLAKNYTSVRKRLELQIRIAMMTPEELLAYKEDKNKSIKSSRKRKAAEVRALQSAIKCAAEDLLRKELETNASSSATNMDPEHMLTRKQPIQLHQGELPGSVPKCSKM